MAYSIVCIRFISLDIVLGTLLPFSAPSKVCKAQPRIHGPVSESGLVGSLAPVIVNGATGHRYRTNVYQPVQKLSTLCTPYVVQAMLVTLLSLRRQTHTLSLVVNCGTGMQGNGLPM